MSLRGKAIKSEIVHILAGHVAILAAMVGVSSFFDPYQTYLLSTPWQGGL